ncbi:putative polyol transporter 1 [Coffea eugenioides]|uniref:putative polyol transporter 1 n=1 Tax=Coffea eugenioides TaxID=49369 RepID=UPI000F60F05A|nr:putative polyol transporter 1 [Coffea eugenioides]
MSSVLLGYDTRVMSGAMIYIQRDLKISDVQQEVLAGTINVYALLGSAIAGRTCDWVGRRYTIAMAGVIFFVGAFFMAFATNYAFLMVGRFVAGIGVGYGLMIAPVYSVEISPRSIRGFTTSFTEMFINFGALLGYVSNYFFAKLATNLGWRFMMGVGAIPSLMLFVGGLVMPESPLWLVLQGRVGMARRISEKTSESLPEAQERLADIKEAAGIPKDNHDEVVEVPKTRTGGRGAWKEMFIHPTRAVLHITIAGIGLCFFQQASGIVTVMMYSPTIFEKAGIKSDSGKLLATISVGVTKTIFLVSAFYLDKFGRRILLLTSTGGLVCSLVGLGIGLTVIDHHPNEKLTWAIAVCFCCVLSSVATFSMGLGPVAWVYSSEIFPLRLRALGSGLAVAMNRLISGVILMTFISLYKAITIGGAFFLFGGVAFAAFVFFFTLLPETRGRGLEEMEEMFGSFFKWRSTVKELEERKKLKAEEEKTNDLA